jgi:hypothetical protein
MKNDDTTKPSYTVADSAALLEESRSIIERARRVLEEPAHESVQQTQKDRKVRQTMSTELTPQMAGELYTSGQSVIEVARAHGMSYAQVRKLLAANGTTIRNSSERLKGRTRKSSES